MVSTEEVVKNSQEQAVAAWISWINCERIRRTLERITAHKGNMADALAELNKLKGEISDLITSNRGGGKGIHGFIAEAAEVAFENIKSFIADSDATHIWVDDNGPIDIIRPDANIQVKFSQLNLGIDAIKKHLEKYPNFIKDGGVYQIPKDYYERLNYFLSLSPEEAGKLSGNDYRLWKAITEFFKQTGLDPSKIEPTMIDYDEVQKGKIDEIIKDKEGEIKEKDKEIQDKIEQSGKANIKEGAKAAVAGAATEGATAFALGVFKKLKAGKTLPQFTAQDWKDVGIDTGKNAVKGAVRGAFIYAATNIADIPAPVASCYLTAVFGVAAQAALLKRGEITEEEFVVNSEVVCLDVAVGAIGSLAGQTLIPIPILGSIIGNAVGTFMYGIAKESLAAREQELIKSCISTFDRYENSLEFRYQTLIAELKGKFAVFSSVSALAFDKDVNVSFAFSVKLAQSVGVKPENILTTKEDIDKYFQ